MLQRIVAYFKGVPPVVIDGALYVLIAVFGTLQTMFTSEEAYKYVAPYILFWGKATCGVLLAGVTALKMYRSTAFAKHVEVKEEEAEGARKQGMEGKRQGTGGD